MKNTFEDKPDFTKTSDDSTFASKVISTVILACIAALFIAITIKIIRWIIGF